MDFSIWNWIFNIDHVFSNPHPVQLSGAPWRRWWRSPTRDCWNLSESRPGSAGVSENSMTLRRRLAWHGHDAWFNPVIHFQYLTNWWIWWVFKPLCLVCWCYSIYIYYIILYYIILYYIIFILYHIILYYITTKSNKTNDVSYMLLR